MGFETPEIHPEQKPEEPKQKPEEEPEQKPEKEEDVLYGETEVKYGPGRQAEITERKSGEKTVRIEREQPATAYEQLTDDERKLLNQEVKKHMNDPKEVGHLFGPELIEEEDSYREQKAKERLAKRQEGLDLKEAA